MSLAFDHSPSDTVANIRAKIAAMGAKFNPDVLAATTALYTPLARAQSVTGVTITTDVAYGNDARQKLDIFRPAGRNLPVLIYIPGGGFTGGDKNVDGVFYGNVGVYFARHGMLTLTANYRLAPAATWPSGAQDISAIITWAKANAATYGGDPNRIVLWGQSAGAAHVAGYLFDPTFHGAGGVGVNAGILMSGIYRLEGTLPPHYASYFSADQSLYAARSPINHIHNGSVPLLLSVAEYDPEPLALPTLDLATAITKRDHKVPQFAFLAGHNHASTVHSIGTPQDDVGARVREFLGAY